MNQHLLGAVLGALQAPRDRAGQPLPKRPYVQLGDALRRADRGPVHARPWTGGSSPKRPLPHSAATTLQGIRIPSFTRHLTE